jgi:uncharacterized protein (TIGR02301 family)
MSRSLFLSLILAAGVVFAPGADAWAQPAAATVQENKPAPYDNQLARLSEILGAVQYLRSICPASGTEEWRKSMSDLLAADTATEPHRRQRMTAAFNRGYRSFASVHTSCTPAAIAAEEKYRNEGATLAQEIASRFGN